jgi:hypothetical protein
MKMPVAYDDDLLAAEIGSYPNGLPRRTEVYSLVYPPIGFFPFADTGNGDYHGFYWPIGREESPPLVAYSSHDAYALIPEYGNLKSAACCQLAQNDERKLIDGFDAAFAAMHEAPPTVEIEEAITAGDHRQLLSLDPNSAFRNCAVADLEIASGNFDSAERYYRRAIELVPEYAAAHFGLGYLFRRTRRQADAAIYLRMALICPLAFSGACFWADHVLPGEFRNDWRRKALLWLQQCKEPPESLHDDPFLARVGELTLAHGVAESRDLDLLTELVDHYANRGQLFDAIYLWTNIGDRAACETTSFRERYGFTATAFGKRLSVLLRAAGFERRASLAENMLAAMEKPNGLYL